MKAKARHSIPLLVTGFLVALGSVGGGLACTAKPQPLLQRNAAGTEKRMSPLERESPPPLPVAPDRASADFTRQFLAESTKTDSASLTASQMLQGDDRRMKQREFLARVEEESVAESVNALLAAEVSPLFFSPRFTEMEDVLLSSPRMIKLLLRAAHGGTGGKREILAAVESGLQKYLEPGNRPPIHAAAAILLAEVDETGRSLPLLCEWYHAEMAFAQAQTDAVPESARIPFPQLPQLPPGVEIDVNVKLDATGNSLLIAGAAHRILDRLHAQVPKDYTFGLGYPGVFSAGPPIRDLPEYRLAELDGHVRISETQGRVSDRIIQAAEQFIAADSSKLGGDK